MFRTPSGARVIAPARLAPLAALASLSALVALTAGAGAARADAPRGNTAVVALEESGKTTRRAIVFTLALADDERPSVLERRDGSRHYKIRVSRRDDKGTPHVELSLEYTDRAVKPVEHFQFHVGVRVPIGARTQLGELSASSGTAAKIYLTLER